MEIFVVNDCKKNHYRYDQECPHRLKQVVEVEALESVYNHLLLYLAYYSVERKQSYKREYSIDSVR